MIVTDKIKLTSKELFKILLTNYLRRRWWQVLGIWVLIIYLLLRTTTNPFDYFIIVALFLLQGIIIFQLWSFATSKYETLLQERYFEMDVDKIVGITSSGVSSTYENRYLFKFMKTRRYYLLYTNRTDFIYLPISSFKSSEDQEWFEHEVIVKIK